MTKKSRPLPLPPSGLPPLNLPPIERIGMTGFYQPKKSAKTTCCAICAAIFAELSYDLRIFQYDEHDRLRSLAEPTMIDLATARDLLDGRSSADLRNHEVLYEALSTLADHPNMLICQDTAATAAERIATVFISGDYNGLLNDAGAKGLFFVPFRPVADVAEGALQMIAALKLAMPDHYVIPVAICNPNALDEIPQRSAFWRVVEEADHGVVTIRAVAESFAQMLERINMPITKLADRKNRAVISQINDELGCGYMVAGAVSANAAALLADFSRELFGPLGFTPGA